MGNGSRSLFVQPLVLRSLKTIRKEPTVVAVILGRPAPDPGVGSAVELSGRHARRLLNLIGVSKTLSRQSIAAEHDGSEFVLQAVLERPVVERGRGVVEAGHGTTPRTGLLEAIVKRRYRVVESAPGRGRRPVEAWRGLVER